MDYIQIKNLVPKNKYDFEPFPQLMMLSEDEIKPIIPELMTWIADMNWPIAENMIDVLIRFPNIVIPQIEAVLQPSHTDTDWKYFIITSLIPRLPIDSQKVLHFAINRIIEEPTEDEKDCVSEVANEYMNNYINLDK